MKMLKVDSWEFNATFVLSCSYRNLKIIFYLLDRILTRPLGTGLNSIGALEYSG